MGVNEIVDLNRGKEIFACTRAKIVDWALRADAILYKGGFVHVDTYKLNKYLSNAFKRRYKYVLGGNVMTLLERDRVCGNCKFMYVNNHYKSCHHPRTSARKVSYIDFCELYEQELIRLKNVYTDKEKQCYVYKVNINGDVVEFLADTYNEIIQYVDIFENHQIEEILKKNIIMENIDFLKFMREQIPDVYRALRNEYYMRKQRYD